MRIVDRTQEAAARIDAFLHVGLYKAIYEKYRNYQLPGPPALEGEIVRLGVAQKQASTARQVFIRSARQAGFFWAGEDRLVRPNIGAATQPETPPQEPAIERTPQFERTDKLSNRRIRGWRIPSFYSGVAAKPSRAWNGLGDRRPRRVGEGRNSKFHAHVSRRWHN